MEATTMEQLTFVANLPDDVRNAKPKRRTRKAKKAKVEVDIEDTLMPFLFPEDYPVEYISQLMAKVSIAWLDSDVSYIQGKLWTDSISTLSLSTSINALDDVLRWVFTPYDGDSSDFAFGTLVHKLFDVPCEFARSSFLLFASQEAIRSESGNRRAIFSKVVKRFASELDNSDVKLTSAEWFAHNENVLKTHRQNKAS
jgi:hypothetical protein